MNKIGVRQNHILQRLQILSKFRWCANRYFSNDSDDDVYEKERQKVNVRSGIMHDKQQSVKEESYFHKEELEQLKTLREKIKDRKAQQPRKNDKEN